MTQRVGGLWVAGARIIDGTGRPPIVDALLEVRGERIARVGSLAGRTPAQPPTGIGYDGRGLTIIPGLIDAHVHAALSPVTYRAARDPMAITDALLAAFLTAGVTTIRDPGSPDVGPLFRALQAGGAAWPRFVGSGPVIDGPPGVHWAGTLVVSSVAEARARAAQLVAGGVDLLKVYFSITAELARAVADVAHEHGLPVAYHPGALPIDEAILGGVDQVEHAHHALDLLGDERPAAAEGLAQSGWDNRSAFRLWQHVDPGSDRARRSIELMAERRTTFVPTLVLTRAVMAGPDTSPVGAAAIAAMPAEVRDRWEAGRPSDPSADRRAFPEVIRRQAAFVRLAHEAGVRVAAGTGGLGNHLVPGVSLHEELRLLVEAGLEPLDALRAATSVAAEVLGRSADLGTLAPDRLADFVVVRGDPSVDIADTARIAAVVKGGRIVAGALPPAVVEPAVG
jgi:imidazolonepropionase-like amidohydrolase